MSNYEISNNEHMQIPSHLQSLLDRLSSGQDTHHEFFQRLNQDIPASIELIQRCLGLHTKYGDVMGSYVQHIAMCLLG